MYNCLIIEDEPLAAEVLKDYIGEVSELHLVAMCRDAMSATEYLRNHKIDVLFVDIHLPKVKGIDFVRTIQNQYQVILTTAYNQYAIEGYDLNVVDYLLKPIEFSRFLQAIQKLKSSHNPMIASSSNSNEPYQFFNVDKKQVKVYIRDILYIESLKDYVKIHTSKNHLVTKLQIGEMEAMLTKANFLRIHKSYLINVDKITAYGANYIEMDGQEIPVGRSYKELVLKQLKGQAD